MRYNTVTIIIYVPGTIQIISMLHDKIKTGTRYDIWFRFATYGVCYVSDTRFFGFFFVVPLL